MVDRVAAQSRHRTWLTTVCVGREDEAKAQYQIASTLELSVADKVELERDMRG